MFRNMKNQSNSPFLWAVVISGMTIASRESLSKELMIAIIAAVFICAIILEIKIRKKKKQEK